MLNKHTLLELANDNGEIPTTKLIAYLTAVTEDLIALSNKLDQLSSLAAKVRSCEAIARHVSKDIEANRNTIANHETVLQDFKLALTTHVEKSNYRDLKAEQLDKAVTKLNEAVAKHEKALQEIDKTLLGLKFSFKEIDMKGHELIERIDHISEDVETIKETVENHDTTISESKTKLSTLTTLFKIIGALAVGIGTIAGACIEFFNK